jgi:uncharacterized membrane protein
MNKEYDLEEYALWLVLVITLIGGALRVLYLGKNGLWLDETFSVWMANHPVGDMLHWTTTLDQHPPLYYLLLHYWMSIFGDTPYYIRLLSALFGTATIPFIYLIGKRLSGVVVGLAAAMLLALSPFNVYFAQEARMYALLMFNVAVAIFALVRLLTDARAVKPIGRQLRDYPRVRRTSQPVTPNTSGEFSYKDLLRDQPGWRGWLYRRRRLPIKAIETDLAWLVFIVFSAATLYTHHTAVFFVLAANVFVVGLMLYRRLRKSASPPALHAPSLGNWVKAQMAICVLWVPWLLTFIQQVGRVDREFWIPAPDGDTIGNTLRYMSNNLVPDRTSEVIMWLLGALLILGLVYYRKKLSIFWLLAALFAVPFLGELIVSVRRPIFLDRTLIWITLPLFLLLAAGLAQLRYRLLIILVLGVLVTNYLFADSDYYRFVRKEDWNTAAGYVANFAQQDDLVLFNSNFVVIPFDYYFRTYEDRYAIQVEKQGVPLDLLADGVLEPKMTESDIPRLQSLLQGRDRVWLVYSHDSYTDPQGLVPQTLAAQMKLTQTRNFYGGQVQLYETP